MPKRTNEFQGLIFDIQRQLSSVEAVAESRFLQDRQTGKPVEVDIAIETRSNDFNVVISLEVRARNRPATVEWVREMLGKHSSLPTNKLVLVSKTGFTAEALRKSSENNVEAITYEAAKTFNWSETVKRVKEHEEHTIASFSMSWDNFTLRFAETQLTESLDIEAMLEQRSLLSLDSYYVNPSKAERIQLKQIPGVLLHNHKFAKKIMDSWIKTGKEKFILDVNVPVGGYVSPPNDWQFPIAGFRLEGHSKVKKGLITFQHGVFRDTQVTCGATDNIFNHIFPSSEKAQITIVEKEGQRPSGVLTFNGGSLEEQKSFPIRLSSSQNDSD